MASELQRRKILGVFDPMDADGRGFLVESDFAALAARWTTLRGLSPGMADEIFALLDLNGDGYISREEFRLLWTQSWAGDDPTAPGSWVFGRFDS